MLTVLLSCFIVVLFILFYFQIKSNNINTIVVFLCSCAIIYFIVFPKQCINSTIFGTKIFFLSVFPSLFPFLIICNLLIRFDGINIYSKYFGRLLCKPLRLPMQCSLTLIVSSLCGYPLGAKYCCDIYEKKLITKSQCQRLLNIASNASPLFIIGAVGTSMLGSPEIGYILLISNYISCVIVSFVIKPERGFNIEYRISKENTKGPNNIGQALKESIDNALMSSLSIGGYIVFFSVLIDIVNYNRYLDSLIIYATNGSYLKDAVKALFLGLIELTKGCQLISALSITLNLKCVLISFLSGFSGLSIISQVYSFTYKYPEVSMKKYIKRKAVQGIICSFVTAVLLVLYNSVQSETVFNAGKVPSLWPIILILTLLLLTPVLLSRITKLFHVS